MRVCLFLDVIHTGLRAESFGPSNINAIFFLNAVMLLSCLFSIMLSLVALACDRNFLPSLRIFSARPSSRRSIRPVTFAVAF